MQYWLAKGTMLTSWSLWKGDRPPLLRVCEGKRGEEKDSFCYYQETNGCEIFIHAMYGLEIMFPKLDMINGGVVRVEITETEKGYLIEKVEK